MLEVRSHVEVDAPANEVFGFVADASNNPIWQKGIRSCVWTSHGPIAEASTYHQEASFLRRRMVSSFIVSDFEPGRSITFDTLESTFPIEITRLVEPLAARRCRVSAHVSGEPRGLFRFAAPLTNRVVARLVAQDHRRLVRHFAAR